MPLIWMSEICAHLYTRHPACRLPWRVAVILNDGAFTKYPVYQNLVQSCTCSACQLQMVLTSTMKWELFPRSESAVSWHWTWSWTLCKDLRKGAVKVWSVRKLVLPRSLLLTFGSIAKKSQTPSLPASSLPMLPSSVSFVRPGTT